MVNTRFPAEAAEPEFAGSGATGEEFDESLEYPDIDSRLTSIVEGMFERCLAEQEYKQALALDYHMLFCLDYRLREPVNYVRANWIRPEDLHHYEKMGFDNFKIVERNTPTPELLRRANAYA